MVAILCLSAVLTFTDASEIDGPSAIAAIKKALAPLNSIQSVQCRFSWTYVRDTAIKMPVEPTWGSGRRSYEWGMNGTKEFIHFLGTNDEQEYLVSFDGERSYRTLFKKAPSFPETVIISGRVPDFEFVQTPEDIMGRRIRLTGHSIDDLLDSTQCTFEGVVEVEGHRCAKVICGAIELTSGKPLDVALFFDTELDYFPRRIEIRRPNWRWPEWQLTWTLKEIQDVTDMRTGRKRRFPKAATFREWGGDYLYRVDDVVINSPISDSKFLSPFDKGMDVAGNPESSREETHITDVAKQVDEMIEEVVRSADHATPPSAASSPDHQATPRSPVNSAERQTIPASAVPIRSRALPRMVLVTAAACLAAVVLVWMLRKRSA